MMVNDAPPRLFSCDGFGRLSLLLCLGIMLMWAVSYSRAVQIVYVEPVGAYTKWGDGA